VSSNIFARTRWAGGTGPINRTRTGWLDPATDQLGEDLDLPVEDLRVEREARGDRIGAGGDELARQEQVKLVQRVFLAQSSKPRRAVLFAGVERDNGCAQICLRAGQTLARLTSQSVCVVDANLRSPVLHQSVGADNQEGLAAAVDQPGSAPSFARRMELTNLWVLPSGASTSDPDLLLTAERVQPCLKALAVLFNRILITAPPINLYAESLALSQFVDGVVLVLAAHLTRREIVRNIKEHLDDLNIPLLGLILNDRTFPIPKAVYRLL
jgi:Mrp family chromosome partitioning ATPase